MAKKLFIPEDSGLNQIIDELLHNFTFVNFKNKGKEAISNEDLIKKELITDKSISEKAEIHQKKISNKVRHIDADKVDGYDIDDTEAQDYSAVIFDIKNKKLIAGEVSGMGLLKKVLFALNENLFVLKDGTKLFPCPATMIINNEGDVIYAT